MERRFHLSRPALFRTVATALTLAASAAAIGASSYSETYQDKLTHCQNITSGAFTYAMSIPSDADTSSFDQFTTVNVTVGDVTFSTQLGVDCRFSQGKTSARVQQVVQLPGGGGALALDVQLSWGGGVFNGVIRGFPPLSGSPLADTLYATAAPGQVSGNVAASVNFVSSSANVTFQSSTPVSGTLIEKTKNSCNTQFAIKRIKLAGAAQ